MKKLNQDSYFNIKNAGVFFKQFMIVERECVLLWEKWLQWLVIFKSETTFEMKSLKVVHIFLSSGICFSASLRIIFSCFDAFL